MRYERMFLAAVASAIFFFLGGQFGSMAIQFAAQEPLSLTFSHFRPSLQLALFALPSGGFTLLALAFLLFAIIKIASLCNARHLHLFFKARAVGIFFVRVAFAVAALWVAVNIALQ